MSPSKIGREATTPAHIPLAGWKDIARRVKRRTGEDHLTTLAGGIAFFVFLSVFPGIGVVVSVYGLTFDPARVNEQIAALSGFLPPGAVGLLTEQLWHLASRGHTLSLGLVLGMLLMLWSASRAMKATITALNIVYKESERRDFVRFNMMGVFLTVCVIASFALVLSIIVAVPSLLGTLGLPVSVTTLTRVLRWPILGLFAAIGIALLYRHAPNRKPAKLAWVTWGSVLATLLWLGISALFSHYVFYFGNFNEVYGSLGAVIILLLWLYLSALSVLIGAEINAEVEHQTGEDTTTGPPRPMGERGAYVADTLAECRETEE
ncbi:MAG: YihY/virulence factor BrkB family protein [Chloroflexota bacterium]